MKTASVYRKNGVDTFGCFVNKQETSEGFNLFNVYLGTQPPFPAGRISIAFPPHFLVLFVV